MNKKVLIVCLVFLTLAGNASVIAKTDSANSTASVKETTSEQVKDWFVQYDAVRRDFEPTTEESLHTLTTVFNPINWFRLGDSCSDLLLPKYRRALEKIRTLPVCAETKKLSDTWTSYLNEASAFSLQMRKTAQSKSSDLDKEKFAERMKRIDSLAIEATNLDSKLRSQYGLKALRPRKIESLFAFGEDTLTERLAK